MALFRKKAPPKKEAPEEKVQPLQEIQRIRILTAEGWKRKMLNAFAAPAKKPEKSGKK